MALKPHIENVSFDVYPLLEGSAFTCEMGSWPDGNQPVQPNPVIEVQD